eukprot:COSAG02_NODE_47786_length_338_cov_1.355649_1_plen_88_part_10
MLAHPALLATALRLSSDATLTAAITPTPSFLEAGGRDSSSPSLGASARGRDRDGVQPVAHLRHQHGRLSAHHLLSLRRRNRTTAAAAA